MRILDIVVAKGGFADAINDRGHIVGTGGPKLAFLWENGASAGLGEFNAKVISSSDLVAGFVDARDGRHAVMWHDGALTVLPGLSDKDSGFVWGVNGSGLLVGQSFPAESQWPHGVLWKNGRVYDLNGLVALPAYLTITVGRAINDKGQIVCQVRDTRDGGSDRIVILSPY